LHQRVINLVLKVCDGLRHCGLEPCAGGLVELNKNCNE
jgi:hypothetical protein